MIKRANQFGQALAGELLRDGETRDAASIRHKMPQRRQPSEKAVSLLIVTFTPQPSPAGPGATVSTGLGLKIVSRIGEIHGGHFEMTLLSKNGAVARIYPPASD